MIILFAALVFAALVAVFSFLLPELKKKPEIKATVKKLKLVSLDGPFDPASSENTESKLEKLERLIAEKNRSIALLERQLKIFQTEERSFDKVRSLLEAEIQRLKEQNRIFRSELGLPTIGSRQGSIS